MTNKNKVEDYRKLVIEKREDIVKALKESQDKQIYYELFHVEEPDNDGVIKIGGMCAGCVIASGALGYKFTQTQISDALGRLVDTLILSSPDSEILYQGDSLRYLPKLDYSYFPEYIKNKLRKYYASLAKQEPLKKYYIEELNDVHKLTFAEIADCINACYTEEALKI